MMYQSLATSQGRAFERESVEALEAAGFRITDRGRPTLSVEIDIVALNMAGILFYFSCKGSERGSRPGCIRTDTLRKAIAEGYLLYREQVTGPYTSPIVPLTVLTSHLPENGRGLEMLRLLEPHILYDVITIDDTAKLHDIARIRQYDYHV